MNYKINIVVLLSFFVISCSTQKQLQRDFVGEPVAELNKSFGVPKTIIDNAEGKIYVFEKEEKLRSTEIDQGKLTLDPIVTPKVVKTERFYFTIENGIVKDARVEEEYER